MPTLKSHSTTSTNPAFLNASVTSLSPTTSNGCPNPPPSLDKHLPPLIERAALAQRPAVRPIHARSLEGLYPPAGPAAALRRPGVRGHDASPDGAEQVAHVDEVKVVGAEGPGVRGVLEREL